MNLPLLPLPYLILGGTKISAAVEVSFYLCGGCVPSSMKVRAIATYVTVAGIVLG